MLSLLPLSLLLFLLLYCTALVVLYCIFNSHYLSCWWAKEGTTPGGFNNYLAYNNLGKVVFDVLSIPV